MYPTLFSFLGYPVPAYGFFMAMAHLMGLLAILFIARWHHRPLEPFLDLFFIVSLFGLLGARAGYALTHRHEFPGLREFFSLQQGGLSFFTGLLLAFPAYLLFLRWRRLPVLEISDMVAPVLPFSLAWIRLGCFGAGCCYGMPTNLPWALHFHADSRVPPQLAGLALHPTQLYEAIALATLTGALLWTSGRRVLRPGVLATITLLSYACYRFGADFLRADNTRGFAGIGWLSLTQAAALGVIAGTPVALAFCAKSARSVSVRPSW